MKKKDLKMTTIEGFRVLDKRKKRINFKYVAYAKTPRKLIKNILCARCCERLLEKIS